MVGFILGFVAGIVATTSVVSATTVKNYIKITVDFLKEAAKEVLERIKSFFEKDDKDAESFEEGFYAKVLIKDIVDNVKDKTPRSRDDISKKAETMGFENLMVYPRDNYATTCSECVYLRVEDKNGNPIPGIEDIKIFGDEIDEEIVSEMIITV